MMSALLLKLVYIGTSALLGAIAGWWIRGAESANEPVSSAPPVPEPSILSDESPDTSDVAPEIDAVDTMMAQLQQLTANVAADVGLHNSKVQKINEELSEASSDTSNVLSVVEKLIQANGDMQSQLADAETRLHEQSQEIDTHVKEARTDALTNLWNRRHFDNEMLKSKESLDNAGCLSCVMMLDVDNFKKFNDTHGHQAGDAVLQGVARTLQMHAGQNTVCRYGGEEFAIIFTGLDMRTVIPTAEKVRASIGEQIFDFEGMDLRVTTSGGLAQFRSDESIDDVVKRADDALYVCKENGRDCGYWHDGQESHPMDGIEPLTLVDSDLSDSTPEEPTPPPLDCSSRDAITGLSDRTYFHEILVHRIAEWKRGGTSLSVLIVEIDNYESLLASHGDTVGGVALRAAAQFLRAAMRDMDFISKYNDHQFGMLLPEATVEAASSVAERLLTAIAKCSLPVNGKRVSLTVSFGATQVADNDNDATIIARALLSLDAAKEAGGNCCRATQESGELIS